jgi:integrase
VPNKIDKRRFSIHHDSMPRAAHPTVRRCPWKEERWIVDGLRDDQGKRFRKFFETKESAKTWLANHREKSLVEGRAGLTFTEPQRADARRALAELTSFKGATLTDAARNYADFLRRTERTVPVAELIALFLEAKKADGRAPRYLSDLRARLRHFAESFGEKPTAAVSTRDLDEWLHGLSVGPQSRVNYRRVLHVLFNFACAREFARENPVTRTGKPKVFAKEPGILTPAQFERLLNAADEKLRPALAIGGFAGLRPTEVHRLTWDAVNLEERLISVSAKTSKTASRRLVPICDNLLPWLLRAPKRVGPVMPLSEMIERDLALEAREAAGIKKWPADGLRHSWVTYRFALTGDAARTAAEAGHDQAVLHRHYRALATKTVAERWFAIIPSDGEAKPVPFDPKAARA